MIKLSIYLENLSIFCSCSVSNFDSRYLNHWFWISLSSNHLLSNILKNSGLAFIFSRKSFFCSIRRKPNGCVCWILMKSKHCTSPQSRDDLLSILLCSRSVTNKHFRYLESSFLTNRLVMFFSVFFPFQHMFRIYVPNFLLQDFKSEILNLSWNISGNFHKSHRFVQCM